MRTILIIILSAFGLACQAQESGIGADLTAAARKGALRVTLAHAIGERWSAGADAELDFSLLRERMSAEEAGHYGEVGTGSWPYGEGAYRLGASVQYWPERALHGVFLSAGMSWSEGAGLDMTAGAGYHVRIWKGLGAGIAYEMDLLKTYRYGVSGDEIKIVLSYLF